MKDEKIENYNNNETLENYEKNLIKIKN